MATIQELLQHHMLVQWKQSEEILRLYIRPRPRWMPELLYDWILRHLLYIESERSSVFPSVHTKP